ncbi:S8 family serine peptidase [Candidatus Bathyarchaeota archaeon]|nr:S8 family serine peptidase [Candidatus Bathyarchaeota archaeon]
MNHPDSMASILCAVSAKILVISFAFASVTSTAGRSKTTMSQLQRQALERILCPRARHTTTCDIDSDLYGFFDLTSFTTPHATGIYVLLKQAFLKATPRQIKQTILESCDPAYMPIVSRITSLPTGFFYRLQAALKRFFSRKKFDEKHSIGYGRVNAYRAYLKLKELMNAGKT